MSEYERGFEDAIHLVLIKVDEVKNLSELKYELEKILRSAFKIRISTTLRRLEI